ncbi:MAG: thioredoxin domain-containing protein [Nevskiaceae bacterium]|jgi:uncharacterized protein YyaL (SSP411 family)|nr:thioredoxin domain-containing protein [Nevskiaceae bacterium]
MSDTAPRVHRNRLADQTSPYLLQHADNPVDWYPWGEEAFELARTTGRPILLSIGYSACHWCHVMAHESFEDSATAQVMNELFVNIKVDREERPDVDRIYQLAHQLLTHRAGGWPLTMFLTHDDRRPFFGGTYFPPQPRFGLPGFAALLKRVADVYREQAPALREQSALLVETLARIDQPATPTEDTLNTAPIATLRAQLEQRFDRHWGGFGAAPKFPHPPMLQRLLRNWRATAQSDTPDLHALFMTTLTLKRMIEGGIFDQIGGGFARYSVDERWEIPHFEKMLYDNGPLLSVLADAALATGDADFARAATATADCLLRDFRTADGAFAASFDADSQGGEGAFYTWTAQEVADVLTPEDAALFNARYGLNAEANFEGRWLPVVRASVAELASDSRFAARSEQDINTRLHHANAKLLAQRALRPWPARDDKRLTAWNGLAIAGLADAARALGREDWADAAINAVDAIRHHHWRDGRLYTASRGSVEARIAACLDDHAFVIDALLRLTTVRFRAQDLHFAAALADAMLFRFEDHTHGGFWFSANDDPWLIHRSRTFTDDAMPAGSAVAAGALLRLGGVLAEPRYLEAAERTLRAGWSQLTEQPLACVQLTLALEDWLHPPKIVVIRGEAAEVQSWRRELQRSYDPTLAVYAIPTDTASDNLPAALAAKQPQGRTTAWLCRGLQCDEPMTTLAQLRAALT